MKNKMIDLHNALFVELETLQDEDSFKDDDGKINMDKVEIAIKRADKVSDIASKIIDLQNLQLNAYKLAIYSGANVNFPETLGIEERK